MNYSTDESNIMRMLAIGALATAFVVTLVITLNSGILGGDDPGSGSEPAGEEAPVAADPAAEGQEPPPAEEPAAEPGDAPADNSEPITLETETYVVEGGDSFFSIATRFDTTIDELLRLNPAVNPQNLMPGTELAVPRSATDEEE